MNRFRALLHSRFSIGLVAIGLLALAFGLAAGPLNASLAGLRSATPVPPTPVPTAVQLAPTAIPSPTVAPTVPPTATAVQEDATVVAVATMLALLRDATPIPTSTSIPTPTPLVVPATGPPFELRIPRIGVDAPVEAVGIDRDGAMGTPSGPFRVGWFDLGYYPGEAGNAVIDGHVDYVRVGPAVFWRLGELTAGDKILVAMPPKRQLTFVVERTAVYTSDNAPISEIFGPSDVPRLNLVTCTGVFDRATRNYDRRLVVFAKLIGAS